MVIHRRGQASWRAVDKVSPRPQVVLTNNQDLTWAFGDYSQSTAPTTTTTTF